MAHFIPTRSSLTAIDFSFLFADRIVRYHGLPQVIVSDRDTRFVSEFWQAYCKRFGIQRALSSAWHPQTDGQTERVNRTIEQMLRTYIQSREEDWPTLLPALELAYNCASHSSTSLSPFEVMIGENPLRAQDLDVIEVFPPTVTPPMTKAFRALVDRATAHLEQAQLQQKNYADATRREVTYEVGDKVWLSTRYLAQRGNSKLTARYVGPYQILAKIGKVAYKLDLPPTMHVHPVFHVSLLTPDRPRPQDMATPPDWEPLDQQPEEDPVYEAEHILDHKVEDDQEFFLVKWKGFPASDATWEPISNLTGATALIRAYRTTLTRKRRRLTQTPQPATQ